MVTSMSATAAGRPLSADTSPLLAALLLVLLVELLLLLQP